MEFSKGDVDELMVNSAWKDIKERLEDVRNSLIAELIKMDLPQAIEIRKIDTLLSLPATMRQELKEKENARGT